MPMNGSRGRKRGAIPPWLRLLWVLAPLLTLVACAGVSATPPAATHAPRASVIYDGNATLAHPSPYALVDFSAATTTPQAFALLANLGLLPYSWCAGIGEGPGVRWQSPAMGLTSVRDQPDVLDNATLVYAPGAGVAPDLGLAAPADWIARLTMLPQLDVIEDGAWGGGCMMIPIEQETPGHAYFLDSARARPSPTYLQVRFASTVLYADAVTVALDQGMRLARPCAEAARAPWAPLSQERAYASGHTLTLALTAASSTLWREQLLALPGVRSIAAPYAPAC